MSDSPSPSSRRRMSVQRRKRVRLELLRRDGDACQGTCGRTYGLGLLTIDHRTPLSRGGTNELINLQLMCGPCNLAKADRMETLT